MNPVKNQHGFTILELMIATMVFGVMMLFATTGMIEIGRAYYKGITSSKTQEVARSVERDVANAVQGGKNLAIESGELPAAVKTDGSKTASKFNIQAKCIGKSRYSYIVGVRADRSNQTGSGEKTIKHALWFDNRQTAAGACTPVDLTEDNPSAQTTWSADTDPGDSAKAQQRDMLATNMRLAKFDVNQAGPGVRIDIKTMYGVDDVIDQNETTLVDTAPFYTNTDVFANDSCQSQRLGGQFCAFSELKSFVSKR